MDVAGYKLEQTLSSSHATVTKHQTRAQTLRSRDVEEAFEHTEELPFQTTPQIRCTAALRRSCRILR
jgi:hypothetical protein